MKGTFNGEGVDMSGGGVIAPPGAYTLRVKKVYDTDKQGNPKVTKNGDPMVSALCEVDDAGPYLGATVFYNVTFMARNPDGSAKKGSGMAVQFLKVIGEPWEGEFEYDTDRWIGRSFRAKLKVSNGFDGSPRNEIAALIDPDKPESGDNDGVPF